MKAAPTPEAACCFFFFFFFFCRAGTMPFGGGVEEVAVEIFWRMTTGDINDHYARMAEIGFGPGWPGEV